MILVVLILCIVAASTLGLNILMIHGLFAGSHESILRGFGEHLVLERRHNVTQLSFKQVYSKPVSKHVRIVDVPLDSGDMDCHEYITSDGAFDPRPKFSKAMWDKGDFITGDTLGFLWCAREVVERFLADKELFRSLESSRFDVAVVDLKGNIPGVALARALGLPVASFWSFHFQGGEVFHTSAFNPPSLYPALGSGLPSKMSFFERAKNFALAATQMMYERTTQHFITESFDKVIPGLPSASQLVHDIDVHLVGANFFTDAPRVLPPNVIYIGGIHLRDNNQLSQVLCTLYLKIRVLTSIDKIYRTLKTT